MTRTQIIWFIVFLVLAVTAGLMSGIDPNTWKGLGFTFVIAGVFVAGTGYGERP